MIPQTAYIRCPDGQRELRQRYVHLCAAFSEIMFTPTIPLITLDVRRGAREFDMSHQRSLADISQDMDMALDNIVPETLNWRHTDEGPE